MGPPSIQGCLPMKAVIRPKVRLLVSLFYTISLCRECSDNSAVCITENDFF
jgi:hypothetical protein